MSGDALLTRFGGNRVIPVVAIESLDTALPLADALLVGGISVIEITFRTAIASQVIQLLSRERPQMLVGAGTVLTLDNLESAKASGAAFAVAPGLNPRVVLQAEKLGIPFLPGVATPTDIEAALELNCRLLKFFPAEALGGVPMLEALSAPYRHTGVKFMPTGGITPANLPAYLKLPAVAAVGGTWLARPEDFQTAKWDEICRRCVTAREIADRLS